MKHILALDVGLKRTGAAFAHVQEGTLVALDTIEHATLKELAVALLAIIAAREIDCLVVGLPLLASGEEGQQAAVVREFIDSLPLPAAIAVHYIDERFTSVPSETSDTDAGAACAILDVFLKRHKLVDKY